MLSAALSDGGALITHEAKWLETPEVFLDFSSLRTQTIKGLLYFLLGLNKFKVNRCQRFLFSSLLLFQRLSSSYLKWDYHLEDARAQTINVNRVRVPVVQRGVRPQSISKKKKKNLLPP